jgi:Fungal specific transcription factor domain
MGSSSHPSEPPLAAPADSTRLSTYPTTPQSAVSSSSPVNQCGPKIGNSLNIKDPRHSLEDYSLDAFPGRLGLQWGLMLHRPEPIGYNLALTSAQMSSYKVHGAVFSLVSLEMVQYYIRIFFACDFPACGFLDQDHLIASCEQYWTSRVNQDLPFEALMCGIIALAHIMSSPGMPPTETNIARHASTILEDHVLLANPSVELLVAMFLRTLYLRATASLKVTWLYSCAVMHMAEVLGLHRQQNDTMLDEGYTSRMANLVQPKHSITDTRKVLFWMICAMNRMFSYDLGRTPVYIHQVSTAFPFSDSDRSGTAILCRLGRFLPEHRVSFNIGSLELDQALDFIESTDPGNHLVALLSADVCFCLYRLNRVNPNPSRAALSKYQLQRIVVIGRRAIEVVNLVLQKSQPWWNMLSTLFQFACVLISMDSESLEDLVSTVNTINLVREHYPWCPITDALSTVRKLVVALKQRKEKEMAYLEVAENLGMHPPPSASPFKVGEVDRVSAAFSPTTECGLPTASAAAFPTLNLTLDEWDNMDLAWMSESSMLSLDCT